MTDKCDQIYVIKAWLTRIIPSQFDFNKTRTYKTTIKRKQFTKEAIIRQIGFEFHYTNPAIILLVGSIY